MTDRDQQSAAVPRLFGTAFRERPEAAYASLRAAGPVAWAEVADGVRVLVVTDHAAARALLGEPAYTRDPGAWEALARDSVPPGLALMYAGGVQHTDAEEHQRLRRVVDDCLACVDLHSVRRGVQRYARELVKAFAHRGHADLMAEFAERVSVHTLVELLGGTADIAERVRAYAWPVVDALPEAAEASGELNRALGEVVAAKRARPGADVTSWMLAHPAALGDREAELLLRSTVVLGATSTAAWIGATLHTLLTEPAYAGELVGGAVTIRDAMDATLATRCPVANASVHYARRPTTLLGVAIPAGVPILISHAATGPDPARPGVPRSRDRSHLAWSAGPHRCPAQAVASTIAEAAIETVVDALWDLSTPTPAISGRPGPFRRCPAHLGVLFAPDGGRGAGGQPARGDGEPVVDTDSGSGLKGVTAGHVVPA
ncbi:cytochrome P450 [Embleya sp. NPDC001921]